MLASGDEPLPICVCPAPITNGAPPQALVFHYSNPEPRLVSLHGSCARRGRGQPLAEDSCVYNARLQGPRARVLSSQGPGRVGKLLAALPLTQDSCSVPAPSAFVTRADCSPAQQGGQPHQLLGGEAFSPFLLSTLKCMPPI